MESSARKASQPDLKRLQFEVTESRLKAIDDMVVECEFRTRKDLFDHALTLMKWAIRESSKGNRIASFNQDDHSITMLCIPAFDDMHDRYVNTKMTSVRDHLNRDGVGEGIVYNLR